MININIPAIVVSNGLAAALSCILIFSKHKRIRMIHFDDYAFYALCLITLIQAITEALCYILNGKIYRGGHIIFLCLNILNYSLSAIMALIWVLYVDYKLFEDFTRIKRRLPFLGIPVCINLILVFCNLFTPVFFFVTEQNTFARTSIAFLAFIFTYFYMTYGMVMVLYYEKRLDKYIFMPVMMFLAPLYLGTILQYVLYGITLIWVCAAFGLTSLYINLQNEESYLDSLTGLYNRNYLFSFLQCEFNKNHHLSGIMLDLNAFKKINDNYGHLEGDFALKTAGNLLLHSAEKNCLVARYAGDEFVIIMRYPTPNQAERIKQTIQLNVENYNKKSNKPYHLSFSIGICDLSVKSVDEFFKIMDENMYQEKRAYYHIHDHKTK